MTSVRDELRPPTYGAIAPAQTIGRYMVLSRVEGREGGTGQVYAAYDPKLDRKVALKLLHKHSEADRTRVMQNATGLARLSDPHLVRVHEVEEYGGRPLLVMEFVAGQTLKDWQQGHPVDAGEQRVLRALEILLEAGQGLMAAHAEGLVLPSFGPDNVLVGDDGRVRVTGFSVAVATGDGQEWSSGVATQRPLAPELLAGQAHDGRSQQFSFCVTAWEVLFGELPSFADKGLENSNCLSRTNVPPGVRQALRKGLAIRPDGRYPGMGVLLARLEQEVEALRGQKRATHRWGGWRYFGLLAMVGGVAVGVRELNQARLMRACVAEENAVDDLWNPNRRRLVREGLAATRFGETFDIVDDVEPWLDKYADSWSTQTRAACVNTTLRETWTRAETDSVRWCLEDRRLEFAALLDELADADETSAQHAIEAAAGLSPVETCADPASLSIAPIATDQSHRALRPAMKGVRAALSHARALEAIGKYERALLAAREARQAADALAWPPLVAAARGREASVLANLGLYDEAEAVGTLAFLDASAAGAWDVAAAGAAQLSNLTGGDGQRHREGLLWAELGAVAILHAGDPLRLRESTRLQNLARVHTMAGAYDDALGAVQTALAIEEKALGAHHPSLAVSYERLGSIYHEKGESQSALRLLNQALAFMVESVGEHHPKTAACYNSIGMVLDEMGDFGAALEAYAKACGVFEATLGEENAVTARCYDNLGNVYRGQGRHEDALRTIGKAISVFERTLGTKHPDTGIAYSNLAFVYYDKADYQQALVLFHKALAIEEFVLGTEHPATAASYNNLGLVHYENGEYREALGFYTRALSVRSAVLGNHPDTASTINNIAGVYGKLGDDERMLEGYLRALAMKKKTLRGDSLALAASYNNVGGGYLATGDPSRALEFFRKSLSIRERVLGLNHLSTANTHNNIGSLLLGVGDYAGGLKHYKLALDVRMDLLGPVHPHTAASLGNVGFAYASAGNYDKALALYHRGLASKRASVGTRHLSTALVLNNIGYMQEKKGMYSEALVSHLEALAIEKELLGDSHRDTVNSRTRIARLCAKRELSSACQKLR